MRHANVDGGKSAIICSARASGFMYWLCFRIDARDHNTVGLESQTNCTSGFPA